MPDRQVTAPLYTMLTRGRHANVSTPSHRQGWAGIFSMTTLPEARGMGAAHTLLSLVADWAAARAAAHMYLQVEIDKDPAPQLYDTSKFTDLCRYHYRERVSP